MASIDKERKRENIMYYTVHITSSTKSFKNEYYTLEDAKANLESLKQYFNRMVKGTYYWAIYDPEDHTVESGKAKN